MESSSWSGRRIAGLAGIAFAVVTIVGFALGDPPVFDDPAADVREFFVDGDAQVHAATWLAGLAFVFLFLPFAAGLRNLLAAAEEADEHMWARLSYTGAVLMTAISLVGLSFHEVLSLGTAESLSDETLVALARFDTVLFLALLPWAMALFLVAASIVIIRSGVLARWVGWLGGTGSLMLTVGTLWIFAEDDESALALLAAIGILVLFLWILVAGATMARSGEQPAPRDVHRLDREMTTSS